MTGRSSITSRVRLGVSEWVRRVPISKPGQGGAENENARTDPRDVRESFPRLHQILLTRFCRENIHPLYRKRAFSSGFGRIPPRANEATRRISRDDGRGYIRSHAGASGGRRGARASPSSPRALPPVIPHQIIHPPNSLSPGLLLHRRGAPRVTLPFPPASPSPRVCRYTRSESSR